MITKTTRESQEKSANMCLENVHGIERQFAVGEAVRQADSE